MTEVGEIPAGWDVVELSQLANVKYGKARPKTEGDIPVYGSGGIYALANQFLIEYPSIIIGRKGSAGETFFVDTPCWVSDTCFYLEWTTPLSVPYLAAYMSANKLSGEHAKTTLPSLQKPDLETYLVPLPTIDEQSQIAGALDHIDEKIAAEEDRKDALQDFFRSMLQQLMTGQIRLLSDEGLEGLLHGQR